MSMVRWDLHRILDNWVEFRAELEPLLVDDDERRRLIARRVHYLSQVSSWSSQEILLLVTRNNILRYLPYAAEDHTWGNLCCWLVGSKFPEDSEAPPVPADF